MSLSGILCTDYIAQQPRDRGGSAQAKIAELVHRVFQLDHFSHQVLIPAWQHIQHQLARSDELVVPARSQGSHTLVRKLDILQTAHFQLVGIPAAPHVIDIMLFQFMWDQQTPGYLHARLFGEGFDTLGGIAQMRTNIKTGDQADAWVCLHDLQVGIQPTRQEEHIIIRISHNLTRGGAKNDL